MSDKIFLNKYFENISNLIKPNDELLNKIISVKRILLDAKESKSKVMIFGNGGSAAIASHFSVDLTKTANIRSVNYNEADLITCFSNDYGYERWVEKAIDFGLGARGLRSICEAIMLEAMFEFPSDETKKELRISASYVKDQLSKTSLSKLKAA